MEGVLSAAVAEWMSIEVFDGSTSASTWADAYGDLLVEAALLEGAKDWDWHRNTWGVVFEVCFDDEEAWERFRNGLAMQSALDAVPDPVSGVLVYKGRGGSSGKRDPRKPRPLIGSGAAALPLPVEWIDDSVQFAPERRLLTVG